MSGLLNLRYLNPNIGFGAIKSVREDNPLYKKRTNAVPFGCRIVFLNRAKQYAGEKTDIKNSRMITSRFVGK